MNVLKIVDIVSDILMFQNFILDYYHSGQIKIQIKKKIMYHNLLKNLMKLEK